MKKLTIGVAAVALVAASLPVSAADPAPMKLDVGKESSLQEVVISVSDLPRMKAAFTDVLKWSVKHEGSAKSGVARSWGLSPRTKIDEVLLGNAQSTYGYVRLVQIKDQAQKVIRPVGRWWDTGGLFNINVLVKDADAVESGLSKQGWHALAMPSTYEIGKAKGKSQMMVGPDDVVLSFQQRISPPLTGWPEFESATHIEVGYQLVKDVEAWYPFWTDVLGLATREARDRVSSKPVGENDYGLPHNLVGVDDSRQGGVFPRKGGEQLIGVRKFVNAEGYDFSDRAVPPNLGLMTVRLPFADIDPIVAKAKAAGIAFAAEPQIVDIAPYGKVKTAAFRAPQSGLWVEVFEQGAEPLNRAAMEELLKSGATGTWKSFGGGASGKMAYRSDGTAMVSWQTGQDEGTWTLKGNSICLSWKGMRDGREQCAHYYAVDGKTYQSFQVDGTPDGFNTFD